MNATCPLPVQLDAAPWKETPPSASALTVENHWSTSPLQLRNQRKKSMWSKSQNDLFSSFSSTLANNQLWGNF